MNYGFLRIGAAVPELRVAGCGYNVEKIKELVIKAEKNGTRILVFPELSITGYTCADLFQQSRLLSSAIEGVSSLVDFSREKEIIILIGAPIFFDNRLYNCAFVIQKGKILGVVPKTHIPNYGEFYEGRWFASGNELKGKSINILGQDTPIGIDIIFKAKIYKGNNSVINPNTINSCFSESLTEFTFGIEMCEDLWMPIPPSSHQTLSGAEVIFNLSASNEIVGKYEYRKSLVSSQSAKCICAYAYASAGVNESTTDVVFGGHAMIAEYGTMLLENERFCNSSDLIYTDIDIHKIRVDRIKSNTFMNYTDKKDFRVIEFSTRETNYYINKPTQIEVEEIQDFEAELEKSSYYLVRDYDKTPFVPYDLSKRDVHCKEIFSIQTSGLAKRYRHLGAVGINKAVIGISGGLDSTLALLVTVKAFDLLEFNRANIIAVTMPGFGTTNTTYNNAMELMKYMGVTIKEIDIIPACMQHFSDIKHNPETHDLTYENSQARERTQILMDIATKENALVIGTGDLSELALGWCTYNGDHMSMYSVNCSVPKTLVKYLVEWVADNVTEAGTKDVLHRIIETPISPELIPPDENGDIKQKTEDIVGPYELHDFFLYHVVRYGASPRKVLFLAEHTFKNQYDTDTINKWLRIFYKRFFSQQFKRSCLPDGPKVGTISLSPRGDWRMPSDASAEEWLRY